MGLVYAPQTIGKGATSGNFRFTNTNPRFFGFGGGTGAIGKGIATVGRFVAKNYKFFTGVTSVGVGTGVANLIGSGNNQFGETHSTISHRRNPNGYRPKYKFGQSRRAKNSRQSCKNRCICKSCVHRTMATNRRSASRKYNRYR